MGGVDTECIQCNCSMGSAVSLSFWSDQKQTFSTVLPLHMKFSSFMTWYSPCIFFEVSH